MTRILKEVRYWNLNTRDKFNIHFPGYGDPPNPDNFDEAKFIATRDQFAKETKWTYSGETDLILVNVSVGESEAVLDYSQVVALTFEAAIRDKAFPSAPWLLEHLVHFMANSGGYSPVFVFSDCIAAKLAGSTLKKFLLSLAPKWLRGPAQAALHLRIRDVAKKPARFGHEHP